MAQALPKPESDRFEENCFLGVRESVRGFAWLERLDAGGLNRAAAISQRFDLPELLGRILAGRGADLESVPDMLEPTLKRLMPDPATLQDMASAAARIADAVMGGERVAIFGDYDVDGASSSALMSRFLGFHGIEARIYIPDRIFEGYGPNRAAIEKLIDEGAQLVVTVDCGTTSHDALAVGKARGVDIVVVDHHQADEQLPDVHSVVNPNRQDDLSGVGHLCAAGVVFLLLVASTRELRTRGYYKAGKTPPDLLEWLDLVALATVCDVVPLKGLNRGYVTKGLQVMRHRRNPGLRALADVARLNGPPNAYHLGFVLGPRINAGGRIGEAGLGARLLSIEDAHEAERIAALLDKLNGERKAMEAAILEEVIVAAELEIESDPQLPILIAGSTDWHKGLVGLVASRLTERFSRPSLVLSWNDKGEGTGSLRSIAGVDIGQAVRRCVSEGVLIKGGGHAMAAGLTVAEDRLAALREALTDMLRDSVAASRGRAGLKIDGALTPSSITGDFMSLVERAGPYGAGNPTPRFAFPSHRCKFAKVVGDAHVKCVLEAGDGAKLDAIAFRAVNSEVGAALLNSAGRPLHVVGQVRRDSWGGRERIQATIEDVAVPSR